MIQKGHASAFSHLSTVSRDAVISVDRRLDGRNYKVILGPSCGKF